MKRYLVYDVRPGAVQVLQTLELLGDGVVDSVPAGVKGVDLFAGAAGLTHLLTVRRHRLQLPELLLALVLEASRCIQQRLHFGHRRRSPVKNIHQHYSTA